MSCLAIQAQQRNAAAFVGNQMHVNFAAAKDWRPLVNVGDNGDGCESGSDDNDDDDANDGDVLKVDDSADQGRRMLPCGQSVAKLLKHC